MFLDDEIPPVYFWRQGFEDVTVWFEPGETFTKSDVEIEIQNLTLDVSLKGETLLSGSLFRPIEPELSTWSITEGK